MELETTQPKPDWTERSPTINKLAEALTKAQSTMAAAKKDVKNEFFKSKYADLASCWDAAREPLTKNGLSVLQEPHTEQGFISISTTLLHTSGEFVRSTLRLPVVKQDPQGYGSAITYARRYSFCAVVGISPEDDDGNAASLPNGNGGGKPPAKVDPKAIAGIKTADQAQTEAAKKVFGDDQPPGLASGIYTYDLTGYLSKKAPQVAEAFREKLRGKQGISNEAWPDVWTVPEYIEGLRQFIKADSQEAA